MHYVQLTSSGTLPDLSALQPFMAVVIIEDAVTPDHQAAISRWLVATGCRYMMAWGQECRAWGDSVDLANREAFDHEEIPDDRIVITTWHENEPLREVFWFSKHSAMHPCFRLNNVVLLHLSPVPRERELSAEYAGA